MQNNIIKTKVPISQLRVGDTVEINNELLTVNKGDIKQDSFMGVSFRGDSSQNTITKIQFKVLTNKGIILR